MSSQAPPSVVVLKGSRPRVAPPPSPRTLRVLFCFQDGPDSWRSETSGCAPLSGYQPVISDHHGQAHPEKLFCFRLPPLGGWGGIRERSDRNQQGEAAQGFWRARKPEGGIFSPPFGGLLFRQSLRPKKRCSVTRINTGSHRSNLSHACSRSDQRLLK